MYPVARLGAGIVLTLVLLFAIGLADGRSPSAVATSPGVPVPGEPITATQAAVMNLTVLAQQEAANPPTAPLTPIVHPFLTGGEDALAPPPTGVAGALVGSIEGGPPLSASPAVAQSFQAASDNLSEIPPDTNGAVGPNHLMVTHNGTLKIQNRSGGTLSSVTLDSFWSSVLITVTFATFDPHVLYDPYNNRWLVTATAYGGSPDSSLLIGASATSDPTGIWYLFRVDADSGDTTWADYPTMGFNKDWVAVSLNMFTNSSNAFSTGKTYVFNKANLFANNSAGSFVYTTGSSAFTLVPAVTFDNSLNTVHLVRHSSSASGLIKKSTLVGDAPAMPTFTLDTATVTSALGSWSVPGGDFLPQPNSARFIDVGDARMRSVVYRNGTLWCTQTIVLPAGGAPTHAALQWWQLDSNASSSTILQQGRLEDPSATQSNSGYHYAYPALAVNLAGDVLVGFSRFSLASYASAGYAYHFAGDAAGTLRDPVVLKAGEDVYVKTYGGSRNRWGDYSNTVVDPLNDLDMWTIQEYAATASPPGSSSDGAGRWATWWGQMVLQHLYLPTILK